MPRRRARLVLVCALLASGMGGGWLWLRSSPLVAVEHVRVSGLHGPDARAIATALAGAARQMSTLHMNPATLRAAVASFPVVRSVRAIPSFPHSLRIEVSEQLPVAALTIDGARTAVAADGVVLGPALLSGSLPTLSGADAAEPLVGQHLKDQSLLAELTALGAAPAPLEKLIARVFSSTGNDGLTVAMRNGLLVYFGDASRPHAKWLSLVRVLADPSSAGATYIDVRLPERPAAGFSSAGATSTGVAAGTSTAGQTVTPESTVAALAANLTATTDGEPTPAAGATPAGGSTSTTEAAASTTPEAEPSAGTAGSTAAGESETPAATAAPGG
jgi:cell division protein FtsQ